MISMPRLRFGAVVGKFDIAFDAIEEGGSDGEKSVARVAVGDGADVLVDAEDFLDDDEAGDGRSGWTGDVGIELMAVGCGEFDCFAHGFLIG